MSMTLSQILLTAAGIGMSVDRSIPLSERLSIGFQTAVIGLLMVFSILMILWGVLALFRVFFYELPKKRRGHAAPDPVKPELVTPAPAQIERQAPEAAGEEDDSEIVAAITAAVAAYLEAESAENSDIPATGFRVVSFRRAGRR